MTWSGRDGAVLMLHLRLAAIAMVLVACGGGGGGVCVESEQRSVQQTTCISIHMCRDEFNLSEQQFNALYRVDYPACLAGPVLPMVGTIVNGNPEGTGPVVARVDRLGNCETAIARASCDELRDGSLLEPGNYCGEDVLSGRTPPPSNLDEYCHDTL